MRALAMTANLDSYFALSAQAMQKVFGVETNIDVIKHHGSTDPLILIGVLEHHGVSHKQVYWANGTEICFAASSL